MSKELKMRILQVITQGKKKMTVQQLCDRLTELCHEGCAQYEVLHTSGMEIKKVTRAEEVGKTVLITSWKNLEEYKDELYREE